MVFRNTSADQNGGHNFLGRSGDDGKTQYDGVDEFSVDFHSERLFELKIKTKNTYLN